MGIYSWMNNKVECWWGVWLSFVFIFPIFVYDVVCQYNDGVFEDKGWVSKYD